MSTVLSTSNLSQIQRILWSGRKRWQNIGLQLGMCMDDLETIQLDNPLHTDDCFTKMLSEWLRRTVPKPTLEALISALQSPPVGLEHLAVELAQRGAACS